MQNIEIRKMMPSDIEELLIIENEAYLDGENWGRKEFLSELENNCYYPIVTITNNEIAGFSSAIILAGEMQITSVTTKAKFRNQKIATQMLLHLFNIGYENNILSCILEVRENNFSAIKLYEKFGFTKIGVRKKYYANKHDALVFSISDINSSDVLKNFERLSKQLCLIK